MDSDACYEYESLVGDQYESLVGDEDALFFDSEDEAIPEECKEYQVLNDKQVHQEIEKISADVSTIIGYSEDISRILLHHFNWNKEVLIEKFYEASELSAYGIVESAHDDLEDANKRKKYCLICDERIRKDWHELGCKHKFCMDCWSQYLYHKIMTYGELRILCPAEKCTVVVSDDTVIRLVDDSSVRQKFRKLVFDAFISSNKLMTFCPANGCELACKVKLSGCQPIKCDCGLEYCFQCGENWHNPISCELLKIWQNQCQSDGATFNWISAYTKDCPKCKSAIEKNGGCNHMSCRIPSCRYQFCWVCLDVWKDYAHACNRFAETIEEHEKKVSSARGVLERYLHYYNRYRNHEDSLKLEYKLYETIENRAKALQEEEGVSIMDTTCFKAAVDVLGICRRTLKYTYAFAFYLQQNSNITKIFEDNQENLETAIESLSDLLENKFSEIIDLNTMRQTVQDKMHYVHRRQQILLEHCREGTERNQWAFKIKIQSGCVPFH